MEHSIERAAVIGAGVMGAALAAHLANAGIPTLLLDIVPPEGSGVDGDPSSRQYRDAFARRGLERVQTSKPNAFYTKGKSHLITVGNIEDDAAQLANVDWVLEAVTERIDVKKTVFDLIGGHLNDSAVLSSNSSGLSVNEMAAGLPDQLQKRFIVTHFFNPPRYMHLLEIVACDATDPAVIDAMSELGERRLGKGVVLAKDTPNFIANRIGSFSMAATIRAMIDGGFTTEEVDALTGAVIGRPKSATFRTADLVGLDVLSHASRTVYDRAEEDEWRDYFKLPDVIDQMLQKRLLGDKTGQGFYKKTKKNGVTEILTLDLGTMEYRPRQKPKFPSLEMVRGIDDAGDRIKAVLKAKDRASEMVWRVLSETLVYSAARLGEISDDVSQIDNAMKWGFNWQHGPFELLDVLGVERTASKLEKEGKTIPGSVQRVLQSKSKRFYDTETEGKLFYFTADAEYKEQQPRGDRIVLKDVKKAGRVLKKNAGASLIDLGDGVLCVEFHSKMNAIGGDIMQMLQTAVKETESGYEGLIIGNQGANFSVGANLMLLLLEAQDANFEEIDLIVRSFQKTMMALKYCKRPVVAAPFGMALGGGCEVCLGAGHVYASAETYIGLVEMGVGLVPAGGGCKELVLRHLEGMPPIADADVFPFVRAAFETIGTAKYSTSGDEARELRFLRRSDGVAMNPQSLIHLAKKKALALASQEYRPPAPAVDIPVAGEQGIASIKTHLYMLREGKFISEYDAYLGEELARILCGGRIPAGTRVSEQHFLDLEREVFLRLCGQRKTLERMQHMLKKGKPLRN